MRLALAVSALCFVSTARAEAISESRTLLPAIQIDALTVTPIIATGQLPKATDLLVLDEAFAKGLVQIHEHGTMDQNNLTLTNKSDRPLFVLSGEVVIGGKQDRIIGANTVIPANTTQDVPVFCVEHGRSSGKTNVFTTAKALAHGRLRGQASYRDQDEVWAEVKTKNERRKTQNPTDTYRAVAVQQTNGALASHEKKLAAALAKISTDDKKRMVGFVVALDGKVATIDMFGSPALFAKLQDKLVKSYVTEAVDVKATAANKPPTTKDIKAFMTESTTAGVQKAHETAAATTSVQKGATTANSSVDDANVNLYRNYQSM